MVMDINQRFTDVLKLAGAYYCVQIVNVTLVSRVTDEHLTSVVVNVSIGKEWVFLYQGLIGHV